MEKEESLFILEALKLMFLLIDSHQAPEFLSFPVDHALWYRAWLFESEVDSAMKGFDHQIVGDGSCSNGHPIGEFMHSRCELGGIGFEDQ